MSSGVPDTHSKGNHDGLKTSVSGDGKYDHPSNPNLP
jgi:hypothetical protein